MKGCVLVDSNETRWMVGGTTRRKSAARLENETRKAMNVGGHDAAKTALPVPRKGCRHGAGRGRGMMTRQLRGGVCCRRVGVSHRRVAGAEGLPSQRRQGTGVAHGPRAFADRGDGAAGRARDDAAAVEAAPAGPRPERADQLAQVRSLRVSKRAEEGRVPASPDLWTVLAIAGAGA